MRRFVGRADELAQLRRLKQKKTSSMVVIRGRRRIGKSRLAEEFGKEYSSAFLFSGLPPKENQDASQEKEEFARQLHRCRIPTLSKDDWGDLFYALAKHCEKGSVLIVLDEISWMGSKDSTFLGKLKTAWDLYFSKNPQLMLIISGSHSTWINENIISSTGFVGRISRTIDLKELPLNDCAKFWNRHAQISPYEIFKVLCVTGGVPRYLEEIQPQFSAENNLLNLCFEPGALLVNEFEQVFSDLFSKRNVLYKDIIKKLIDGPLTLQEIAHKLGRSKSGDISSYLKDLCLTGFLTRDYTWSLSSQEASKLSKFRLSDNYVRFYLKYIEPNKDRIERGDFTKMPQSWLSIAGLQFENLVVNNRQALYKALSLSKNEVISANPFFQTQTKRYRGCQIDFLIQTRFKIVYICEIKFKSEKVSSKVVNEVKAKIERIRLPRGFSYRPVLIHVNGVSNSVIESEFFAHIVDFNQMSAS